VASGVVGVVVVIVVVDVCNRSQMKTSKCMFKFLADRTIGRAFGTMCRLSVYL